MRNLTGRSFLLAGLLMTAMVISPAPALAAAPRLMMVYGAALAKPVLISSWGANSAVMQATGDSTSVVRAKLTGRPSMRVAMFWGLYWMRYMQHHKPLSAVHPADANQFGRFYPAYGAAPALFVFDSIPGPYTSLIRRIGALGLTTLARYGIPVRIPVTKIHG